MGAKEQNKLTVVLQSLTAADREIVVGALQVLTKKIHDLEFKEEALKHLLKNPRDMN